MSIIQLLLIHVRKRRKEKVNEKRDFKREPDSLIKK